MPVLKVITRDVYVEDDNFLVLHLNHPELKHVELRPNQRVVAVLCCICGNMKTEGGIS